MGGWNTTGHYGWQPRQERSANLPQIGGRWTAPDFGIAIVAFLVHWELCVAFVALKLWQQASGYRGSVFGFARDKWESLVAATRGVISGSSSLAQRFTARSSGNHAFDAWRQTELDRIETEPAAAEHRHTVRVETGAAAAAVKEARRTAGTAVRLRHRRRYGRNLAHLLANFFVTEILHLDLAEERRVASEDLLIRSIRMAFAAGIALAASASAAAPVTAIVAAYEPEWLVLLPKLVDHQDHVVGGVHFVSGTMAGAPVLLVESGIGPVNAAFATQIAIDRFDARRIVNVGIAGGIDAAVPLGDVVVPERWSEYLYSIFARSDGQSFKPPGFAENKSAHYGMIFPQPAPVGPISGNAASRRWLSVDLGLLTVARKATAGLKLERCVSTARCLAQDPHIVIGGNGVSGSAFVDNADFRRFLADTFQARATDMETAAVAHVAAANHVPFIAFRSVSDLAGGNADSNQMEVFQALAARNASVVLQAFMAGLRDKDGS